MATVSIQQTTRAPEPNPSIPPASGIVPHTGAAPGNRHRLWYGLALFLALAIGAGVFLLSRNSSAPQYTAARIDRGDIDATVTTTGSLNAVITVQVGSQVSGNIIALYADFNTKVKKGQLVAEIDPAPFQAVVAQVTATRDAAKAAVSTAEAGLAKSQSDLASAQANIASQNANLLKTQSVVDLAKVENDRRQVMVRNGSTSQEDADTSLATYNQAVASLAAGRAAVNAAQAAADSAQKAVEVARAQVEQAKAVVQQDEASLSQARLNLEHTRILAPVDGTVESRNMDVGQTVAASFSAPTIFLIAQDLTKMQVDTNVDEADVGPIRLDQPATFTVDAYPGQTFKGKVAQIRQAPINVQNVITYDIVINVSNPDLKLFPGMTANATIFTGHVANVLRIPKAALRYKPNSAGNAGAGRQGVPPKQTGLQTVYIVGQNGQPQAIQVKTGLSDANRVEALGGDLSEGQEVVTGVATKSGTTSSPPQGNVSTKKLGF